jgi:hypothetical protein
MAERRPGGSRGVAAMVDEAPALEAGDRGSTHLTPAELRRRLTQDAARVRSVVEALPVAFWLGSLVFASSMLLVAFGRRLPVPWVFPDELLYAELAKSFADSGSFAVRDVASSSYGIVYPALIAPAWALFESVPGAYAAAKSVNAVLFSLAALPAYGLARRVLGRGLSFLAAVLAVAIPSSAYSGLIMTENAFYPAFLVTCLVLVLALERPTVARQVLALSSIFGAFLVRPQAVALVPALASAILLVCLLDARGANGRLAWETLRRLRSFWVVWLSFAGGAVALVARPLVAGRSPFEVLGGYEVAARLYSPVAIPRWFLYHAAELDLYLGIVPFMAFLVLLPIAFARSQASRPLKVFMASAVALVFWMTLVASAFSTLPFFSAQRIHERALFYVAPLFLIALLAWIERGLPRPRRLTVATVAVGAAMPAVLPFGDLRYNAAFEALALIPWDNTLLSAGQVPFAVAAFGVIAGGAFVLLPRRAAAVVLPALVLLNFYVVGTAARAQVVAASEHTQAVGVGGERDWIDRAVGSQARVAVLWSQDPAAPRWTHDLFAKRRAVWQSEFFNRSVGTVYSVGHPLPYNLPDRPARLEATGALVTGAGRPVRAPYVVAFRSTGVVGTVVAADASTGLRLYRVEGPVRVRAGASE